MRFQLHLLIRQTKRILKIEKDIRCNHWKQWTLMVWFYSFQVFIFLRLFNYFFSLFFFIIILLFSYNNIFTIPYLPGNSFFKFADGVAVAGSGQCSRWTLKAPEQREWRHSGVFIVSYLASNSGAFSVNFELVNIDLVRFHQHI